MWGNFREHHYLNSELNLASNIYVCYWNNVLVGMCAVLPIPSGNIKHSFRASRTVILPDYQNLKIGTRLSEFIGEYYLSKGLKFYYRSTHLRLRQFWEKSPIWISTSHNNRTADANKNFSNNSASLNRICGSYEYMGKNYINQHIDIYVDYNDSMNNQLEVIKSDLKYLKDKGYYITVITGNVKEDNPIDLMCQELGIRTQLLYYRGKISGINKNKNIIKKWDKEFSKQVRDYFKGE